MTDEFEPLRRMFGEVAGVLDWMTALLHADPSRDTIDVVTESLETLSSEFRKAFQ